jgi:Family of unknown function (DUF7019)
MPDLKTYIYISGTKVDMWYEQIASARDRSGAEYGFDFKFLKWIGKREAKAPSLITKVQRIEEALNVSKRVGQFPNFLEFVSGELAMRWGIVRGMACFVTQTARLGLMLVGSSEHLLGGQTQTEALLRVTSFDVTRILRELSAEYPGAKLRPTSSAPDASASPQLNPIAATIEGFEAPTQRLQFLAKTLLHGQVGEKYIVCASPLYVALAE